MTKVFVGGISRDTTEESLADYFELHFGSIITVDIKRQWSALSRHFAFVTLTDSKAALRAVTANDHHIDGHDVEVEYAKLQPDRHPVRVQSAAKPVVGVGGTSPNENEEGVSRGRKLFVGGLAPKTEECTLSEHFRQYGSVDNAAIKRYPNGVSKQFGFVTFSTLAAARWAVMQEAHFVDGRSMNVDYAEYQPDRRPARVRSVAAHATQKEIEDWLHDARSVKKATAPTSTGRPAWGNSEENGASRSIPRQNAIGSAVAPARSADCSTRSFDKAMDILHAAGIVVRWGAP